MAHIVRNMCCSVKYASLWDTSSGNSWENMISQVVYGEPLQVVKVSKRKGRLQVRAAHYPEHLGWISREEVKPFFPFQWQGPVQYAHPLQGLDEYLNRPYLWGGRTPYQGFDCSGLVQWLHFACGLKIPRDAQEQEEFGQKIPFDELQEGDLITYNGREEPFTEAAHIAFWFGEGKIAHSVWYSDENHGVRCELESESLKMRRRAAVRILIP